MDEEVVQVAGDALGELVALLLAQLDLVFDGLHLRQPRVDRGQVERTLQRPRSLHGLSQLDRAAEIRIAQDLLLRVGQLQMADQRVQLGVEPLVVGVHGLEVAAAGLHFVHGVPDVLEQVVVLVQPRLHVLGVPNRVLQELHQLVDALLARHD